MGVGIPGVPADLLLAASFGPRLTEAGPVRFLHLCRVPGQTDIHTHLLPSSMSPVGTHDNPPEPHLVCESQKEERWMEPGPVPPAPHPEPVRADAEETGQQPTGQPTHLRNRFSLCLWRQPEGGNGLTVPSDGSIRMPSSAKYLSKARDPTVLPVVYRVCSRARRNETLLSGFLTE